MRTMAVNALVLTLVLGGAEVSFGQPFPGGDTKPPAKDGTPPASAAKAGAPTTLEEMLAQALKNHADIRVAEAKVREADALLEQARLQVAQKVITHYHTLQAQKTAVEKAEATLGRMTRLHEARTLSPEEFQAARQAVIAEKAKLAELEAQTPLLLGNKTRPSAASGTGSTGDPVFLNSIISEPGSHYFVLDKFSVSSTQPKWAEVSFFLTSPPRGTMAERMRKALDTSVTVDYKDRTIDDILKDIKEKMPGVAFLDNVPKEFRKMKETLQLTEQVPLGAALQALSDNLGLGFAARDYGILVTVEKLPANAVSLHDFWKSDAGKEKPKPEAGPTKNSPKREVQGTIKAVDDKSGLVAISIGSDAGLEAGHTLEMFRLDPKPKYLGTLKLLEVRANEAYGKPAMLSGAKIEVGDRVANEILGASKVRDH